MAKNRIHRINEEVQRELASLLRTVKDPRVKDLSLIHISKEISYKMISYNHHSMRGNLQEKKNTILKLAELLEAKRTELAKVDIPVRQSK